MNNQFNVNEIEAIRNIGKEHYKDISKKTENIRNLALSKAALQAIHEDKVVVEVFGIREESDQFNYLNEPYTQEGFREIEIKMPTFYVVEEEYALFPNSIIHRIKEGIDRLEAIKQTEAEIERLEGLV